MLRLRTPGTDRPRTKWGGQSFAGLAASSQVSPLGCSQTIRDGSIIAKCELNLDPCRLYLTSEKSKPFAFGLVPWLWQIKHIWPPANLYCKTP